jgi:O-antigen/teichoic acid export membrane protein
MPAPATPNDWSKRLRGLWQNGLAEVWAVSDQALVSGLNFATTILLARVLGFREFGVFTVLWLTVLFVNSLQMAVIVSPMMSIGPKQGPDEAPQYFGAVLIQQLAFALSTSVLVGIGIVLSGYVKPEWGVKGLAIPLSLAAFCFALQDFLRRYFFVRERPRFAFINDLVSYGLQVLILLWALGRYSLSASDALLVIAVTSFVAVITGLVALGRMAVPTLAQIRAAALRHWGMAKWLSASAVMQYATTNTFVFAASAYFGAGAAGVLRAAKNIMGLTHIWFFGLENVIPMQAARALHHSGTKGLRRYLVRKTMLWGSASAAFAIVVSVRPDFWLNMFFGQRFAEYGFLLRWYALVYVVVFFGLPIRSGLRALERTRPLFWGYLASSIFSITCAGWITRTWGLVGAMAGLLAAHLILQSISFTGLRSHSQEHVYQARTSFVVPAG